MDVFLEYLMKKKQTGMDVLKQLGLILAGVVASYLVMVLFSMLGNFFASYTLLGVAGVFYGTWILLRNYNLEYEYIFTNGDLDIDVIKAQKTRKRLVSLQCKKIEIMASDKNAVYKREFESDSISKKYNAVFDPALGSIYHVLFTYDGERMLLTFQPPAKLLEAMKKLNPRCVFADEEDLMEEPEE